MKILFLMVIFFSTSLSARGSILVSIGNVKNSLFREKKQLLEVHKYGFTYSLIRKQRIYSNCSFSEHLNSISYLSNMKGFHFKYGLSHGSHNTVLPRNILSLAIIRPYENTVSELHYKHLYYHDSKATNTKLLFYYYTNEGILKYIVLHLNHAKNKTSGQSYKVIFNFKYKQYAVEPFYALGDEFLDAANSTSFTTKGIKLTFSNTYLSIAKKDYVSQVLIKQSEVELGVKWNF